MSEQTDPNASTADDHWEIYVSYVDEKPAVIMVDLGIAKFVPVAEMSNLVWLWVHIQEPDEDGFPSEDEDFRLNEVEDLVTESLVHAATRYVGRITSDGRREFYFYSSDPDGFQVAVTSAMKSAPEYRFENDSADDEEWRHYQDVLYPSPEDFQQIQNQRIITELQQAGDVLTTPRPVDHFVNFKSEQDRDAFTAAAGELGYEAVSRPERDEVPDLPFAVGLLRVDPVDPETVDDFTFELFDLAQQHDGEYEGWASKVVKS